MLKRLYHFFFGRHYWRYSGRRPGRCSCACGATKRVP